MAAASPSGLPTRPVVSEVNGSSPARQGVAAAAVVGGEPGTVGVAADGWSWSLPADSSLGWRHRERTRRGGSQDEEP